MLLFTWEPFSDSLEIRFNRFDDGKEGVKMCQIKKSFKFAMGQYTALIAKEFHMPAAWQSRVAVANKIAI